jgi:hypothetical protein
VIAPTWRSREGGERGVVQEGGASGSVSALPV